VNGQRFREGVVVERQALHGATPQIHPTTLNGLHVPRCGLPDHFPRWINAGNISPRHRSGQKLDAHSGSEANLQDSVVGLDAEQVDDPSGARLIRPRHDDATQPSQDPLRTAEHAHQHAVCKAHRWLISLAGVVNLFALVP
jgi:hypothetical protein